MSIMDRDEDEKLMIDPDDMSAEELRDFLKKALSSMPAFAAAGAGASATYPDPEEDEEDEDDTPKSVSPPPPPKLTPQELFKQTLEEGQALGIFNKGDLPYYKKEILREMKSRPKGDAILSVVSRMKRKIKGASKLPSSPASPPVNKFHYYLLSIARDSGDSSTSSLLKVAIDTRPIDAEGLIKAFCVSQFSVTLSSITKVEQPHPEMYEVYVGGTIAFGITMTRLSNFPFQFEYDGRDYDCLTIHATV